MPVVRDLSTAKRTALLKWLNHPKPPYMRTATVEDLRRALQQAIELEHATIPTYLYTLFSLKDGHNREVAKIISGVVLEEMLHMALACNVLNAIGGEPRIGQQDFVPRFPGGLPGGLRPDLTVSLKKASLEHIRDVFMAIEEPEETSYPRAHHALTIGWFYGEIEKGLKALPADAFSGDPARQVDGWRGPGNLLAVTNLETALQALTEIVDQGEGTTPLDPADGYDEIAHYYRFQEIVEGRRIVLSKDGYSFTGPPVHFDPDGVWPAIDNPDPAALPGDSLARRRAFEFDELYWSLLGKLHEVFNGHPDQLNPAIELMFTLEVAAKRLMQTPLAPGSTATMGPGFRDPRPLATDELQTDETTRRKPRSMKGQPE
jgi:rubrerythrin